MLSHTIAAFSEHLTQKIAETSLTDEQVKTYGRWLVALATTYYIQNSLSKDVPSDTQYAVSAHLEQGFERSIISARLEQRHTKQLLGQTLRLDELRLRVRSEADKEAKLSGWRMIFRLTLINIVAAAYTHSLTISLMTIKNMVRVLIFVLNRREMASARTKRRGPLSSLRTWWSAGTQAFVMDVMMSRMAAKAEAEASPFANAGLEEADPSEASISAMPPLLDGRAAFLESQRVQHAISEAMNFGGLTEVDQAFSVKYVLDSAVPRIVACASAVVDRMLGQRPEHLFSVAGIVQGSELRGLLRDIADGMERAACVSEWVQPRGRRSEAAFPHDQPVSSSPSGVGTRTPGPVVCDGASTGAKSSGASFAAAGGENGDMAEPSPCFPAPVSSSISSDDDIVEFPHGSTVMLDTRGRPIPRRSGDSGDDNILEQLLGCHSTSEDDAQRAEAIRRDQLLKEQMAGYFQELIHSASFGELCVAYASEMLNADLARAGNIPSVRTYNAATDTARMVMVIAYLDGCRLRSMDSDFVVRPYMRLFCEEVVRSTCAS